MKSRKRIFLVFFIIILCIGTDQLTKKIVRSDLPRTKPLTLVKGVLYLVYAENTGGVFALELLLPKKWRGETVTTAVAALLGLSILFLMFANGLRFFPVLGLSLFCGGSLSNLFDRIAFGRVVDFVNLGVVGLQPYIFNLADVAIGAGIIIVICSSVIHLAKATSSKFTGRGR